MIDVLFVAVGLFSLAIGIWRAVRARRTGTGQGLAIGRTSYDGCVFIGLNADRDGVGDGDVLDDLIEQEVAELVRTAA